MTKEEIIDLARESGLFMFGLAVGDRNEKHFDICLFEFAKLVAEKEREECAKMFEKSPALLECAKNALGGCLICGFTPELAMNAIRFRGQE